MSYSTYNLIKVVCPKISKYSATFSLILSLFLFYNNTYAADIFGGLDESLTETLRGSAKNYLYLTEGIISLAAYIKTKNLLVLSGILVVSCFFNVILKMANVS